MGACQSSTAVAAPPAEAAPNNIGKKSTHTQSTRTAMTRSVSDPRLQPPPSPTAPLRTVQLPSTDSKTHDVAIVKVAPKGIQKGYSSGASSDEAEENKDREHRRSDLISLETIRTSLTGSICTNVVRMETRFGKSIESVYDGVHDGEILGSGISGVVRRVTHRETGNKYAVKILDIGLVESDAVLEQLRDEIFIMLQLDHPNIVRLEEVYESTNEIYIVQELCTGGDLFDRLDVQPDYHYTEVQCAQLVKQMLSGVRYLHSRNIVHRDLKLENFLFSSADPDSALKMIDFGLSKHFQFGEILTDAVGTPYAVAPEVVRGSYNEKSDLWSVGVLTYLLLSGETPFGGCDGEPTLEVRDNILSGELSFEPDDTWAHVSDLGKDFVSLLLNPDTVKRPCAKMAQRHEWIQVYASGNKTDDTELDPNVIEGLVHFKELSVMRKLLSEVLSFTLLPEQIQGLRGEFEKIDTEGIGEISLSGLKTLLLKSAETGTLGALTEQEIEDIFNALRVRKSDLTIRWHEFIAGCLSQCKVDEKNLKLAFDRLDNESKGYIIADDLRAMLGSDDFDGSQSLSVVWSNELCPHACESDDARITYEEFRAIMKGQAPEIPGLPQLSPDLAPRRRSSRRTSDILVMEAESFSDLPPVDESTKLDENESIVTPTSTYVRKRSHSLKEKRNKNWVNYYELYDADESWAQSSLVLSGRDSPDVHDLICDGSKTPIEVNRAVYRAHREMRMAVLEASKRFEEEHTRQEHTQKVAPRPPNGSPHHRTSLVMRRGSAPIADLSFLEDKEQQDILEDASGDHGGSSPRTRRRTVSDVTGMMSEAS